MNKLADRFVKLAESKVWREREEAAFSNDCPEEILARLAEDKNFRVRIAVTKSQNCPPQVFVKLADDEYFEVPWAVANSNHCPHDAFVKLADNDDSYTRYLVADNPNCPQAILVKLSTDKDISVRRTVARNPKCPAAILEKLASDEKDILNNIRAAKKKNCPSDVLKKLAENDDWEVCYAVAKHPNCPVEALVNLARRDIDSAVWSAVVGNPNCPESLIRELALSGYKRSLAAAASKRCPADILALLADDVQPYVRKTVAKNPNCAAEVFAKLAEDPDKEFKIQEAVANNPSCPVEIMAKMAISGNASIREAVADNPSCTVEIRKIIFESNHNSATHKASTIQALKLPKSLEQYRNRIESTIKPYIRMEVDETFGEFYFTNRLGLWQSKIGGLPYFPKGHEYPTGPNGKPFHLLIQINFSDMPKLDMFPEEGILQVYLGNAKKYKYGINPDDPLDRSYYRVLFFPEVIYNTDDLITDFDFLSKSNSCLPDFEQVPLKLEPGHGPITSRDYRFSETLPDIDFDNNYRLYKLYKQNLGRSESKIGGYPDFCEDPRIYYQCTPEITFHREGWKQKADEDELILLMQLELSLHIELYEQEDDPDCFFIFIRKSDLLKRDFSKVLYGWQG